VSDLPDHIPVMLKEVMDLLPLKPGGVYLDGTLGLAGHAMAAADLVRPGGCIIGFDWDASLLARAEARLSSQEGVQTRLYNSDFRRAKEFLEDPSEWPSGPPSVDGILLDLGVNNVHLQLAERGFSYKADGPLDMRMDRSHGETAAAYLNRATAADIEKTLWQYGDERWARRIAQVILDRRPLKTTQDLVDCVLAAVPPAKRDKNIHPASRTFQGVRIKINEELDSLEEALEDLAQLLTPQGVMVVLSYHSGEDRAVKTVFKKLALTDGFEVNNRKPILPSSDEVDINPKSRSAKMRAIRRVSEAKK
jgi:16S rRNA (cytosine1402-N4)-methyltransferase